MLHLPNGKTFTIVAEQLSDANRYIGSVQLNGKPLTRSFIRHEEIMAGGELRFVMQATPNKSWATVPTVARTRCHSLTENVD